MLNPIGSGGLNKSYEAQGCDSVPLTKDDAVIERDLASQYGGGLHGRRTASDEVYNLIAMTAAYPTLPIPSHAKVRNPANGRQAVVCISDHFSLPSSLSATAPKASIVARSRLSVGQRRCLRYQRLKRVPSAGRIVCEPLRGAGRGDAGASGGGPGCR